MSMASPLTSVQLLTIPETAERLRCSENHVYALIAAGRIRAVDVARPGSGRPRPASARARWPTTSTQAPSRRRRGGALLRQPPRLTHRPTPPLNGSLEMKIASQAPTAFVSAYEPAGRRTHWWYAYSCRTCGRYQFGRARQLEGITGTRKAGCGHYVRIAIARVYAGRSA